jgi:DNA-binding winged helix-turn-helix (wHTH) protein
VVEESDLKVHIAALRKALGEGPQDQRFVTTMVGRGYQFVAQVEREVIPVTMTPPETHARPSHNLHAALVRPIGRSETIQHLLARLSRVRLLTVAGQAE